MGRQARGTTHHLVQGVAEEDRWETEADRGVNSNLLYFQVTGRRPVDRPEELINKELREMYLREMEHKKMMREIINT